MDVETSREGMLLALDTVKESQLAVEAGWVITSEDLCIYISMRSRREEGPTFLMRASFDDYPARAPSCLFVDPGTKVPGPSAWPTGVGSHPRGICTPGTREFHEDYHKNDAKYPPWDRKKYPFLATVHEIQRLIDTKGNTKLV